MKPRHAAALALLVAWFIMAPPLRPCATRDDPLSAQCLTGVSNNQCFDPGKPLSDWGGFTGDFDSAAECADALAALPDKLNPESPFCANGGDEAMRRQLMCIRRDDPRLAK